MEFWKYQGLGNDFIILEADKPSRPLPPNEVAALCDRHRGVGADGILIVNQQAEYPRMTVFNADGSRPEMCGNGLRCVVRYLRDHYKDYPAKFKVQTDAGLLLVEDGPKGIVVHMNTPEDFGSRTVEVNGQTLRGRFLSMGNPHFVLFDNWTTATVDSLGPAIEANTAFPDGVNVSFAAHTSLSEIQLRVWERGCGWTLACGTGACATAYASWLEGHSTADLLAVHLPGGMLSIGRRNGGLTMTGPATSIFRGNVVLP